MPHPTEKAFKEFCLEAFLSAQTHEKASFFVGPAPQKNNCASAVIFLKCFCGERGIRTLGSAIAEQRFSRPPRSTTPASLPKTKQKIFLSSAYWRRKRDSNPRFRDNGTTVFKTAAFDHSAISPLQK